MPALGQHMAKWPCPEPREGERLLLPWGEAQPRWMPLLPGLSPFPWLSARLCLHWHQSLEGVQREPGGSGCSLGLDAAQEL